MVIRTTSQKLLIYLKELETANDLELFHISSIAINSIVQNISVLNKETY